MCHLVPDGPIPVPRNVVLSIHPLTLVKSFISGTAGSSTHTLSVPPSTDRIFGGLNLTTAAGTAHAIEHVHDQFEPSLSVLQVQYTGFVEHCASESKQECYRSSHHQTVC